MGETTLYSKQQCGLKTDLRSNISMLKKKIVKFSVDRN